MLVAQAKLAHELFFDTKVDESRIEEIRRSLELDKVNLVLVGMPGCGKTTISNIIANRLQRDVLDTDDLIVKKENKSIPEIFSSKGEDYFREVEAECVSEACRYEKAVIATGGGAILRVGNRRALMHNSIVIWLKRPIEVLAREGRPLSSEDNEKMQKMLEYRTPFYEEVSDIIIDAESDPNTTVNTILNIIKPLA